LAAVDWLGKGLDFADALHLTRSLRASAFLTFDQQLANRSKNLAVAPKVELLVVEPAA
jgi:predicted nucleic acid-binding protein